MNNSPIFIYEIGEAELPKLVEIAVQSFAETFAESNSKEDMQNYNERCFTTEQFGREMRSDESWFYFAEYRGKLAGYLKVNVGRAQTELHEIDGFEVERIYVLKQYHGRGVGAALMEHAIEKGRALEKKYLWLGVHEKNYRALRFYSKYGMDEFDEHIFMMGLSPQRDVLLRLSL